jgi:hypothetical protein
MLGVNGSSGNEEAFELYTSIIATEIAEYIVCMHKRSD